MVTVDRFPEVGLCARCRHASQIKNARGNTFYLCERSKADARFARYPRLPVLVCPGYDTLDTAASTEESHPIA